MCGGGGSSSHMSLRDQRGHGAELPHDDRQGVQRGVERDHHLGDDAELDLPTEPHGGDEGDWEEVGRPAEAVTEARLGRSGMKCFRMWGFIMTTRFKPLTQISF